MPAGAAGGASGAAAGGGAAAGSADMRPLILAGHGREARRVQLAHGLDLPGSVRCARVCVCVESCDKFCFGT